MANAMQIKITLLDIKPPVWRRLLITDSMTLDDLHYLIQASMQWQNCHLHEFELNCDMFAEDVGDNEYDELGTSKDTDIKLSLLHLREKDKIVYTYDFGDGWRHQIRIEKIMPIDKKQTYPFCVKAVRACPPEDCGGAWGYANLLEIIADKSHLDHEETMEWLGGNFDPEYASLKVINESLRDDNINFMKKARNLEDI